MTSTQRAFELHALNTLLQRSGCSKSQTPVAYKIATIMPSSCWKFASAVNRLRPTYTMFVVNRGPWVDVRDAIAFW